MERDRRTAASRTRRRARRATGRGTFESSPASRRDELAEVQVVGLRERRVPSRAADRVERPRRRDLGAADHGDYIVALRSDNGKWRSIRGRRSHTTRRRAASRGVTSSTISSIGSASRSRSFATSSPAAGCSATSPRWLPPGSGRRSCARRRGCAPLRRETHAPTGARLVFVPAGRAFASIRARGLAGNRGATPLRALARAVAATHVAPYLGTPPRSQSRGCSGGSAATAMLCQEYETRASTSLAGSDGALGVPVYATFQGGDCQYSRLERPIRPSLVRLAAGLLVGVRRRARARPRALRRPGREARPHPEPRRPERLGGRRA